MLRFLADENFHGDIVRGLMLRQPVLDILRVQDVGLGEADDAEILVWAAANDRIVLSHDRATMPDFAYQRVKDGQKMAGLFLLNDRDPIGQSINEILLMSACSEQSEWRDRVVYLPL